MNPPIFFLKYLKSKTSLKQVNISIFILFITFLISSSVSLINKLFPNKLFEKISAFNKSWNVHSHLASILDMLTPLLIHPSSHKLIFG